MTTWKDGGEYGRLYREITNEDGSLAICRVRVRQVAYHDRSYKTPRPYPQGEENFHLILQAPQMLEALEEIADLGNLCEEADVVRNRMEEIARTAIAAVKGEACAKA